MENKRDPDRKAIGKRIGQIRRRAGLSPIEFADRLQIPVLIMEIAEHGVKEADNASHGPFHIPTQDLMRLLKRISRQFHVPMDWLRYGENPPAGLDEYVIPSKEELTLYLPVTISGPSLVAEMNRTLILVDPSPRLDAERTEIHREYLDNILQKHCFFRQYVIDAGIAESADLARRQMLEALETLRDSGI